jgi:Flp pilus assembly pilin Flp
MKWTGHVGRTLLDRHGATAMEYALIASAVGSVVLGMLSAFYTRINALILTAAP